MTTEDFIHDFLASLADIHATLNLNNTQESVVRNATQLFKACGASLLLFNPSDESLEVSASYGLSETYLTKGAIKAASSLGETINRTPVIIRDVATDPQIQYREEAVKEGIKSIFGLPISAGNTLVGSLRLYFDRARNFSWEDLDYLRAFAQQVGLALRKAFYFSSIREAVTEIHRVPSLSLKDAMNALVKIAARCAHTKGAALFLINPADNTLKNVSSYGLSEKYLRKGPLSIERSLGEVTSGQPVIIANVSTDPRIQYYDQAAEEHIQAIIGLPVMVGEKITGALRWYYPYEFQPDQDDMMWMEYVAHQVGMSLEKNQCMIQLKDRHDYYENILADLDGYWRT
ncbi:MAG: GAF domain-containing protein [Deltaproteobacteria bacterium]|nr:GAF domain-containing protein [Deltaproteobacteria bacterium]